MAKYEYNPSNSALYIYYDQNYGYVMAIKPTEAYRIAGNSFFDCILNIDTHHVAHVYVNKDHYCIPKEVLSVFLDQWAKEKQIASYTIEYV